jgi:GNAT superfamily N-acetyltransferase
LFFCRSERPRKLIGYAIYYVGYSTWNGKKFYLEDIMLTERVRGKGIGKQLFKRICKVSKFYFTILFNTYTQPYLREHYKK